ncbi:MAG TPA: Rieske (2Fe-2S) protein [Flavipsychrobacter sp.]|nr:Rieske (2Fe-2S) protein [Flavipsychrobacter sp.]
MKRRDFIKKSCGSCAAMSVGLLFGSSFLESCGVAKLSVVKATPKDGKVSFPENSFDAGSTKLVRVADYPFDIAVKRQADNSFLALVLMCTHAGYPLVKSGNSFYCTLHGSRFEGSGKVAAGPASRPMLQLPVETADGQIIITLLKPNY